MRLRSQQERSCSRTTMIPTSPEKCRLKHKTSSVEWRKVDLDHLPLGCARPLEIAYCIFKRREREEKRFHASDFEHSRHSLACAGEHYSSSHLLTRNIGRDECSQSGWINIGNITQVENHSWEAFLAPDCTLEQWDILYGQRPFKTKHALTLNVAQSFDLKRVSHGRNCRSGKSTGASAQRLWKAHDSCQPRRTRKTDAQFSRRNRIDTGCVLKA